jgi:hypothetical protein
MLASDVYKRIRFAAAGADLPPETSVQDMANEAGTFLSGMVGWKYLQGRRMAVDIIADQEHIELPDDFQTLEDVRTRNHTVSIVWLGTGRSQNELEVFDVTPYSLAVTVQYAVIPDDSQGVRVDKRGAVPILRTSPVPDTSFLASVLIAYQAGWTTLRDDNDTVVLPDFMQPLYLEVAAEYALGVINRESIDVNSRMARIQGGPLFFQARKVDGNIQPTTGTVRNGTGWPDTTILADPNLFSDVSYVNGS